jgi:hypothetical protein
MKNLARCGAVLFALSLIALSTGPAPAVIRPMWGSGGGGSGGSGLAGVYSGSVTDSVLGTGTAVANFVKSGPPGTGDPLGGWLNFTFGSTTYSNPTSAEHPNARGHGGCGGGDCGNVSPNGGDTIRGVFVSSIASVACTFLFRAAFNPSSFELSGEYRAVTGCSGESGTFLIAQQCYYQEFGTGSGSGSVRRNTGSGSGPGLCT